jgi:hypothetical protein
MKAIGPIRQNGPDSVLDLRLPKHHAAAAAAESRVSFSYEQPLVEPQLMQR